MSEIIKIALENILETSFVCSQSHFQDFMRELITFDFLISFSMDWSRCIWRTFRIIKEVMLIWLCSPYRQWRI